MSSVREAIAARRREVVRRAVVLTLVLAALTAAVWVFYGRESLVVKFRPDQITRVWIPAARLQVASARKPSGSADGVPVLVYHGIVPSGESGNVTPETFIAHMRALKAAGYTTLTMAQFRAFVERGAPVPRRSVLITFDDGRTDSFAGADPVLRAVGFHAVMFAILGDAESAKPFYLTPAELRMVSATGRWDVESHTYLLHEFVKAGEMGASGHALATRAWDDRAGRLESDAEYIARIRRDLTHARAGLSRLSGEPVVALAYPFGDYGQDSEDEFVRRALPLEVSALYPLSFREQSPMLEDTYVYPQDRGQVLRRIYISHDLSAEQLLARLDRGEAKTLPFAESGFASTGWVASNGTLAQGADGRDLASSAESKNSRAEVFLDGSRQWRDYAVDATLTLPASETVSVIARRQGPNDYVAATISGTWSSIERVVNGRPKTFAQSDVSLRTGPFVVHRVTFAVKDDLATLEIDGRPVARTAGLGRALRGGGIGFRVDPLPGGPGRLSLTALSVRPLDDPTLAEAGTPGSVSR